MVKYTVIKYLTLFNIHETLSKSLKSTAQVTVRYYLLCGLWYGNSEKSY